MLKIFIINNNFLNIDSLGEKMGLSKQNKPQTGGNTKQGMRHPDMCYSTRYKFFPIISLQIDSKHHIMKQ